MYSSVTPEEKRLEELSASGNLRTIPDDRRPSSSLVDLSSNDYLGLASNTELLRDFYQECMAENVAMTSSASRLLALNQRPYLDLERLLANLYGRRALLFNSGYHANSGTIPALASGKTLIVADKLVHASIIDGIILSRAHFTRFRHNDLSHLESILAKESKNGWDRILVITESVFSMDGDRCDIDALVSLKKRFNNIMLYVDEAHAIGVEGPAGLGLVAASNNGSEVDVLVGTFGKAIASSGAFVAVSETLKRYLINTSRSLIFSTAIPPATVMWTKKMLEQSLSMDDERRRLKNLASILDPDDHRHIFPFIVGDPKRVVEMSHKLADEGFIVLPIRTPTVPPGTERLRISINAELAPESLTRLKNLLSAMTK